MNISAKRLLSLIESLDYNILQVNYNKIEIERIAHIPEAVKALTNEKKYWEDNVSSDIEEIEALFEAKFDYTKHNLNHIISDLKEIIKEESNLSYMESAWNGDDSCEAACSDPGLQYEKSELISSLWDSFKSNYFD